MAKIYEKIKLKAYKISMSFKKKIFNLWMFLTKNGRPTSYPYLSADSFRAISDHIYDTVDENSPVYNIKSGDKVFVSSSHIFEYFKYIHPKIENPYILITHWGIVPVDEKLTGYIDDKIIHWFGKNVLIEHPKITPIPIGLEDLHRYGTGITSEFGKLSKKNPRKNSKIFYDFKVNTNKEERGLALEFLKKSPLAETQDYKLPPYFYHKKLQSYKFVASPPGAGRECHRTWEAIYLNTVPIVKKSYCEEYFSKAGAPIWVVENWEDIEGVDLDKKYNEIMQKKNESVLWMDYWINIINSKRNGYKR